MTKQIDTLIAAVRAADAEGKEEYFAVRKSGFSHDTLVRREEVTRNETPNT